MQQQTQGTDVADDKKLYFRNSVTLVNDSVSCYSVTGTKPSVGTALRRIRVYFIYEGNAEIPKLKVL